MFSMLEKGTASFPYWIADGHKIRQVLPFLIAFGRGIVQTSYSAVTWPFLPVALFLTFPASSDQEENAPVNPCHKLPLSRTSVANEPPPQRKEQVDSCPRPSSTCHGINLSESNSYSSVDFHAYIYWVNWPSNLAGIARFFLRDHAGSVIALRRCNVSSPPPHQKKSLPEDSAVIHSPEKVVGRKVAAVSAYCAPKLPRWNKIQSVIVEAIHATPLLYLECIVTIVKSTRLHEVGKDSFNRKYCWQTKSKTKMVDLWVLKWPSCVEHF